MPKDLSAYREVAPPGKVDLLYKLSQQVRGQRMLHVNSSRTEGGVAEILQNLVPLLLDLGIRARWEVIQGPESASQAMQCLYHGLQGHEVKASDTMMDTYLDFMRANARTLDLSADVVMTHDSVPLALIEEAPTDSRWIWRCHLDVSHPTRKIWGFVRPYVVKYDAAVFSIPQFAHPLPIPQYLVYPSIDPLSDKNHELNPEETERTLDQLGVPRDKPILLQVSRFKRFKDPLGVVAAYRLIKTHQDCRLVLAGGIPQEDPDGQKVFDEVQEAAGKDPDIHVLSLKPGSDLEINALQRSATIVIQKSTSKGFGLTIAEGMWKGKPVIAGETAGITRQVTFGQTGYTVNSVEGTAFYARYLLNNPAVAEEMGHRAREFARQHFLITRHVGDYLALMSLLGRS
ncbi:MAG: glycosyltransferase [Nitrospiraceae bacterium]